MIIGLMNEITRPDKAPQDPEIEIDTSKYSLEEATDYVLKQIMKYLD